MKMTTLIHERVAAARDGLNPTVIGRMASGWAVLGDTQFLHGYCLLLPDPVVLSINELPTEARSQFLRDMIAIGDALLDVTDAYRINYEILGNTDAALHAHIFARYRTEPPEFITGSVWRYEREVRNSMPFDLGLHKGLMKQLYGSLSKAGLITTPSEANQ